MKTKLILLAMVILPFGAFAASPLTGQWGLKGQSCLSGAPLSKLPNMQTKIAGNFSISDSTMDAAMYLNSIIDKSFGAQLLAQLETKKISLNDLGDPADKQRQLAQIQQAEKQINQLIKGSHCIVSTKNSYSIQEDKLTMTLLSESSDCSGDSAEPAGQVTVYDFKINDVNSFSLINDVKQATTPGCPEGDRVVTTFNRL